jgi:hypothetical protein
MGLTVAYAPVGIANWGAWGGLREVSSFFSPLPTYQCAVV